MREAVLTREEIEQARLRPGLDLTALQIGDGGLRHAEPFRQPVLRPAERLAERCGAGPHAHHNKKLIAPVNQQLMALGNKLPIMSEPWERLREAREAAGYLTAADAARALGVKPPTYTHHENGTAGLSRAGARYAVFFRVSLDWLLTGRGEMKPRRPSSEGIRIPVDGVVGAGAMIEMVGEAAAIEGVDHVELPSDGTLGALRVTGDSMYPRFLDGETVLYDRRPRLASDLIGAVAIVQLDEGGERLIKTIRRGSREALYTLESHNAPPLPDRRIRAAWRFLGLLAR